MGRTSKPLIYAITDGIFPTQIYRSTWHLTKEKARNGHPTKILCGGTILQSNWSEIDEWLTKTARDICTRCLTEYAQLL